MAAPTTQTLPVHRDERGEPVLVVALEQEAPVVVLDRPLLERLAATLDGLDFDGVAGLVLASASERVFVAGADLKAVRDLDDAALHEYLQFGASVFARLHEVPVWTAAAIHGAALGGGLELAMHCDALIGAPGAKPYPIGLPEAGLAICPGWGGTNLLPARIDPARAIAATAAGTPLPYPEAVDAGMFDLIGSDAAGVRALAADWVRGRGAPPHRDGAPSRWIGRDPASAAEALDSARGELGDSGPARAIVDAVEVGLRDGWAAALSCERDHLVRLRHEPAGVQAIAAFFARSK
ncbi:MAG: enoyl-CoA hydratase/isomerase family protein [Planctomycetota bacterium]